MTQCRNRDSPKCATPDKDFASCLLGGGDCGAYDAEDECDWDYGAGGCKISKAAPEYSACKCSYKGAWTCGGKVTQCIIPNSPQCTTPGKDHASCLLGGGDCGAYDTKNSCDCDCKSGGCVISKAALNYSACKCNYRGAWTCSGYAVQCKDPTSDKCENPDKSKTSCKLAKGDCDGY